MGRSGTVTGAIHRGVALDGGRKDDDRSKIRGNRSCRGVIL